MFVSIVIAIIGGIAFGVGLLLPRLKNDIDRKIIDLGLVVFVAAQFIAFVAATCVGGPMGLLSFIPLIVGAIVFCTVVLCCA